MWNHDCVELDTSALPLLSVAAPLAGAASGGPPQQLSLGLYAPDTNAEQRHLGLLAALATFEAAGLSPEAACTAPSPGARTRHVAQASPAQLRAIAIWTWANRAAQGACYSSTVAPAEARLFITTESLRPLHPQARARQVAPANGDRAGPWSRTAGDAAVHTAAPAYLWHDDLRSFSFPFGREHGTPAEELR